jgi:uncharacterized protein (TIGR00369 family)
MSDSSGADAERRERVERMAKINRDFATVVPHNLALGLKFEELDDGLAVMRLPYDERLVGHASIGILHGGVISSLIDACCGAAVFMKLVKPVPIATLDLRIDYLKPATPGEDVLARMECYKVTKNVGFVRGIAYHDDVDDPIASAAGSFIVSTKSYWKKTA